MSTRGHRADQHYYGIAEAVVVDHFDPLGEGRVRLTYPWLDASMETEWCRVCQLYAGNKYGSFFVPEKDDEVLVAFVHGDMRAPIVLGGLYNGEDKPPSALESQPARDQKMIRTKGKHELLFDDTSDQRKIRITSSGEQIVLIDDQDELIRLTTSRGQSIALERKNGSITIETGNGSTSVELDSNGGVTVTGPTSVTVKAQSVKLEASSVELGQAAVEQALLGTTFLARFNSHTHQVGQIPTTPPLVPLDPSVLSSSVKLQT